MLPAVTIVLLSLVVSIVDGTSLGAVDPDACEDMLPKHGTNLPQTGQSPYTIETDKSTYTSGSKITVTLKTTSGSSFKGFLIQARVVGSTTAQGMFDVVPGTKRLCTGDKALTHDGNVSPFGSTLKLTWTAPTPAVGHIEFRVTFVQELKTFWVAEKSAVVQDLTAPPLTTSIPATAPPSGNLPTVVLSSCGKTKGCYRQPLNCQEPNCDAIVTWTSVGDNVNFEVVGKSEGYVSLGLSTDMKMGDDSVIDCRKSSLGTVVVENSKNSGRSNNRLSSELTTGISNIKTSFNNKILRCTFTRAKSPSVNDIKPLTKSYHLLVARGPVIGESKLQHTSPPFVSPQVDFNVNGNFGGTSLDPLIKLHGCLMVLGWILCASIGILMARYMKPMWVNGTLCGEKVWFAVHRGLMISVLLLCCIAFIVIFVSVQGYSNFSILPDKAHPILGIIVTALCVINPILALFRPHPDAKYRPVFNWVHWAVGTCAHVLAVPTIFIGMGITKVGVPNWLTWILVVWVIIHVAIELTLEIHQCCMHKKNKEKREEYEMRAKNDPSVRDTQPPYSGRGFKSLMLGLHITITLIVSIVLVVGIALSPM